MKVILPNESAADKELSMSFRPLIAIIVALESVPPEPEPDPDPQPFGTPGWEEYGETEPGLLLGHRHPDARSNRV